MPSAHMRETWDAAAASDDVDRYVGDPARALSELDSLFQRLGDDPRGGCCVEVGCGPGRMTAHLAGRFDRVIALDVSPGMLATARSAVPAGHVDFLLVGGERLDGVADAVADVLVCYLVLQHLPGRGRVQAYLAEIGRVLAPQGRAFVQLPVLGPGVSPRAWRVLRSAAMPVEARLARRVERRPAYRGYRLTETELATALVATGLVVARRDESDTSPYRFAREVFLRLEKRS